MRSLTYFIGASLDGFVASPDGSTDDLHVPPAFVEHLCKEYPETLPSPARAALRIDSTSNRHFDTVVMGRNTFVPALNAGLASAYPHLEQHACRRPSIPMNTQRSRSTAVTQAHWCEL